MFCLSLAPFLETWLKIKMPGSSLLHHSCVCALPLQDVVNVVGGLGVLLPLLEQVCEAEPVCNGSQEISDLLGPELTSSRGPAAMLLPLNKSSGKAMFPLFLSILVLIISGR